MGGVGAEPASTTSPKVLPAGFLGTRALVRREKAGEHVSLSRVSSQVSWLCARGCLVAGVPSLLGSVVKEVTSFPAVPLPECPPQIPPMQTVLWPWPCSPPFSMRRRRRTQEHQHTRLTGSLEGLGAAEVPALRLTQKQVLFLTSSGSCISRCVSQGLSASCLHTGEDRSVDLLDRSSGVCPTLEDDTSQTAGGCHLQAMPPTSCFFLLPLALCLLLFGSHPRVHPCIQGQCVCVCVCVFVCVCMRVCVCVCVRPRVVCSGCGGQEENSSHKREGLARASQGLMVPNFRSQASAWGPSLALEGQNTHLPIGLTLSRAIPYPSRGLSFPMFQ